MEVLVKVSGKIGHDLSELLNSFSLAHFTADCFGDKLGPEENTLGGIGEVADQFFGRLSLLLEV